MASMKDDLEWHNCNGEILHHLRLLTTPPPGWNGGRPSWALSIVMDKHLEFLPIAYCPVCGERLAEVGQNDRQ